MEKDEKECETYVGPLYFAVFRLVWGQRWWKARRDLVWRNFTLGLLAVRMGERLNRAVYWLQKPKVCVEAVPPLSVWLILISRRLLGTQPHYDI